MAETASITPSLNGRVWLKSVRYTSQNTAVTVADYEDVEHDPRSSVFPIAGRALPTGVTELHGGRNHVLHLRTKTQAEQDRLDVLIRTGDVFFLQVPTTAPAAIDGNLLLPGSMHVLIGRPVKHRIGGVSDEHLYSLPLTEVTPPGPDVVGTTLTLQGLWRLHGSWESVWAAYPTLRDMWDTIGSPEDLVTI